MLKECSFCKISKDTSDFYYRKDNNSYRPNCKDCFNKTLYLSNKNKIKERVKIWQTNNFDKIQQYKATWLDNNPKKRKEVLSNWQKRNKGYVNSQTAKYRAHKLKATPIWADLKAIEEFYKNCPEGYEVDHIIPLRGKLVTGLHVLENLQYLSISENRKKSNKYYGW